jgi:hypothetical protein
MFQRSVRNRVCSAWLLAALVHGCAAETSVDGLSADELGADPAGSASALVEGDQTVNSVLRTTILPPSLGAPMYQWAAGDAPLLRDVPPFAVVTVAASTPRDGFYQVVHAGTWGWIPGAALTLWHEPQAGLSDERNAALALARTGLGFSYWWSNAHWDRAGATIFPDNNIGDCNGVCGNCTHVPTGLVEYGADCSGFVSTVWGYPDQDPSTNPANNGFATRAYSVDRPGRWTTVPLADAIAGDAVVQYDPVDRTGHIFLVAVARNDRGRFTTYECMGCAQGCRAHGRAIADVNPEDWHAIRRAGAGWGG